MAYHLIRLILAAILTEKHGSQYKRVPGPSFAQNPLHFFQHEKELDTFCLQEIAMLTGIGQIGDFLEDLQKAEQNRQEYLNDYKPLRLWILMCWASI